MMFKLWVIGVLLLSSVSVSAQMLDTLAGLGVQGLLTQQSAQSVGQGLSQLNRTQILHDLNRVAMEIKISHPNGYIGVNASSVSGQPFDKINWQVGPDSSDKFYIRLNELDLSTCRYLVSSMNEASEIKINGTSGYQDLCRDKNTVHFIFE